MSDINDEATINAEKQSRRIVTLDAERGCVVISDKTTHKDFLVGEIAESVRSNLLLVGFAHLLVTADDPAARFDDLVSGAWKMAPPRKPRAEKPVSAWAQALMSAKAKAGKKLGTPFTDEELKNWFSSLSISQKMSLRTHPLVVAEYAKLKNSDHVTAIL